ncbi:Pls/PosA family non-ribosomal peptide synthetase [Corynebacterium sp. sy039]|uniref:Pls/PosA family non-ribosomal peptide synthetase n=1 Tax=Corynebacterium sp. sy039 TaxID=2599641 RepID=UPI0011B48255|nr:Pls/PosA family non-ribosomal peptide synthetase [Corynebacterium sp. sy039]QDZ41900.1 amino acid adenylation domain-containing protein [Corynebacterium sp. sy039]
MSISSYPAQFLRSAHAPAPRTLYEIFCATAHDVPDAAAIDDGDILTYGELLDEVHQLADFMHSQGVRRGDRIGIRMPSGHRDLYISILATLAAGAAYVPVDADDPDERAEMVFGEAAINGLFDAQGFHMLAPRSTGDTNRPTPDDDAWIIFTSGSTGKPKGVAVSHRSAAAFVDAESQLFLVNSPGGPLNTDDRVLAGLSVAFDASCEEMWLAWAHGACLVPAPRSLVRSGLDLGPWLIRRDITAVSTVPTLAGMWPSEALDNIRLLIVGGEACSAELVERLSTPEREVWNTYGPTEATVVACATQLYPGKAVSIGLPLAGWDLVVVDEQGNPVAPGEVGELVIGGVGLARYLDPEKDKEKYAPLPQVGWERAYRSGDHVRLEADGLYFIGRIDDQVKIGGRRIELGEVDAHLAALENVRSSTVVVQNTAAGEKVLVGYLSLNDPEQGFDHERARQRLSEIMPAALVPRLHVLDDLPVTTSGKVDKKALPWPLPGTTVEASGLSHTEQWLATLWVEVLGVSISDTDADFFALGGTSLAAATLVGRIRSRVPTLSVRDLYDHPRLGALAEKIDSITPPDSPAAATQPTRIVKPVGMGTRLTQGLIQVPIMTLQATTWVVCLLLLNNVAALCGVPWAHPLNWFWVLLLFLIFATPLGRLPIGGLGARLITHGIAPGTYARGGAVHLRIWAAERLADASGSRSIAGATWVNYYARTLGVKMGKGVNLHSLPPVTGLLSLGKNCSVEPEVDLSGYWVDGDRIHVGTIDIGAGARIGTRSTLMPHTRVGAEAHVEPGSTLMSNAVVKDRARWAGSPAHKVGKSKQHFPDTRPPRRSWWVPIYGLSSIVLALLPLFALAVGGAAMFALSDTPVGLIATAPVGALVAFATYMLMIWLLVRLLGLNLSPKITPVRSFLGWRIWFIERLMDDARTHLFILYASQLTPLWLRSLGAKIGKNVEISTSVMVPQLVEVRDGAFLADDTLIGGYELGGGWLFADHTRIGKRSFVGNSGIAGPGRRLAKKSLVAVLSSTPNKAKAGSNWWGSPPERMRRVQVQAEEGEMRTYNPGLTVKIMRGFVETLRLSAVMVSAVLATSVMVVLQWLYTHHGLALMWLLSGLVLMAAGVVALLITVVVKWLCVGQHKAGDHPLWSWFVWLNELQDTLVEVVAAPWFLGPNLGTGSLNVGLRLLGAKIGKGAWVESYWFPETDLCHVGAGASIGPGTVVQTHLFQDRVMSLGTVTIDAGATLGAHSVALPGSHIGENTTVAPGSLVMRGDQIPPHTLWQGNPIEPTEPLS